MSSMKKTMTPADYSFIGYRFLREVKPEIAHATRIGLPVKGESQKFLTRAVWLNNNKLQSLENLDIFVSSILEEPLNLTWLDLSFNKINEIDAALLIFENLMILYLHGNKIESVKEVTKLKPLKNLRTLTLHGNPVYSKRSYRMYVISNVPQIQNLDFARVTRPEATDAKALSWSVAEEV